MKRRGTVCRNCGGARVWIPKRFGRSSSARKCFECDRSRPEVQAYLNHLTSWRDYEDEYGEPT